MDKRPSQLLAGCAGVHRATVLTFLGVTGAGDRSNRSRQREAKVHQVPLLRNPFESGSPNATACHTDRHCRDRRQISIYLCCKKSSCRAVKPSPAPRPSQSQPGEPPGSGQRAFGGLAHRKRAACLRDNRNVLVQHASAWPESCRWLRRSTPSGCLSASTAARSFATIAGSYSDSAEQ